MADDSGSPNRVVIERMFDAPPDLVWRMWTQPEHFAAWYGPAGATIPAARMDLCVGGVRQVCMEVDTASGMMRMWFTGVHREVVENKRLVYTESMSDENGNLLPPSAMGLPEGHPTTTEVLVELDDLGGRTRMTMTHVGIPEGSPGAAGWRTALDKLATHVAAQPRP